MGQVVGLLLNVLFHDLSRLRRLVGLRLRHPFRRRSGGDDLRGFVELVLED